MAESHSAEESEDSDYEELSVPSSPPAKVPKLVLFYVDHNRDASGLTDEDLKIKFGENLGHQEKQRWKSKHKRAKKRYAKLLHLYMGDNPDYDPSSTSHGSPPTSTRNKSSNGGKRSRNSSSNPRSRYVGIETYDNEYPSPTKRRKKSSANSHNSSSSNARSIDDLFKDINPGSKRVIRDPDKFKLEDHHKIQMTNLVDSMREAARKDWQCNKQSKPAINTMMLLETVVAELSKKLFYKYYLDDTELLEAIRDWIHPLPDGSLPALKIRTECFRIIEKLQLHDYDQSTLEHYLQESEDRSKDPTYQSDIHPNLRSFSKTCMALWANKKEINTNKQLLRKAMEKWIRTLTGSDSTYSDLREEMRESQASIQQRYKILQRQKRDFNFGESKRAKIPEKPWHDFATNPANIVDEDLSAMNRGLANPHPLQDRMNRTFKKMTTSKQASRPSVTGRRVR